MRARARGADRVAAERPDRRPGSLRPVPGVRPGAGRSRQPAAVAHRCARPARCCSDRRPVQRCPDRSGRGAPVAPGKRDVVPSVARGVFPAVRPRREPGPRDDRPRNTPEGRIVLPDRGGGAPVGDRDRERRGRARVGGVSRFRGLGVQSGPGGGSVRGRPPFDTRAAPGPQTGGPSGEHRPADRRGRQAPAAGPRSRVGHAGSVGEGGAETARATDQNAARRVVRARAVGRHPLFRRRDGPGTEPVLGDGPGS